MKDNVLFLQKQASQILSAFNFGKVRYHMAQTGWKYYCGEENYGWEIPSVVRLKELASNLLNSLVTTPDIACDSGGFRAFKKDGLLNLHFVSQGGKEIIEEKSYKGR